MENLLIDALTWLLKLMSFRSKKEKQKLQRAIEYIDDSLKHLKCLINHETSNESDMEYSHAHLKTAHFNIFPILGKVLTGQDCNIIRQSLMSGRIYYHAVKYGKVSDEDIKRDYEERFYLIANNIYNSNTFRHNSNEKVLRELVKDNRVVSGDERKVVLDEIKATCLEDISRIETLRDKYKSQQVLILSPD
ncbi:MAG: hypothetical protein HIU83_12360 [Proteobacteria bacterium]|nr:hypothetical protein [Pseudomonadota bacterium]